MKNPFTASFRARDKPKDAVSAAPLITQIILFLQEYTR